MKLREVRDILEAEVLVGEDKLDEDVPRACGCDLMSDVLAFTMERSLLLTGLTNAQVIRTAEMNDLSAVVFVRGKKPCEEIIEMARERGIPLFWTRYPLYEACGRLYQAGLKGHVC